MNDFAWPMLSTSSAYLEKVSFWAIGPVRSFHPTLELPVSDPCFLFIGCTRTMHLFQVKSIKFKVKNFNSLYTFCFQLYFSYKELNRHISPRKKEGIQRYLLLSN